MSPLLGYFLCLAVLMPALSLEVFFRLVGRTTRLPEVFAFFRTILQLLVSVTSPVKIALATAVLLFAYAFESCWAKRVIAMMVFGLAGFFSLLQILAVSRAAGIGAAAVMICSSAASLVSVSWASRMIDTTATC
jgi:hypothetical protein